MKKINFDTDNYIDNLFDKSLDDLFIKYQDHEKVVNKQLSAMWINEENFPHPEKYKKSWRYFVVHKGKDIHEYKDLEQAKRIAKIYGKNYRVRRHEPTKSELSAQDRVIRREKRYASGFGG